MRRDLLGVLCCVFLCLIVPAGGCTKKKAAPTRLQMCMGDPQRTNSVQASGLRKLDTVPWTNKVRDELRIVTPIFCVVVDSDAYYYVDKHQAVHAISLVDTTKGWMYWDNNDRAATSPVIADDVVYFGSGYGALVALDRLTGKQVWRYQTKKSWFEVQTSNITPSIAYSNGLIFFGNEAGQVFAVDTGSHGLDWSITIPGRITSPIATSDDLLFFSTSNGNLHALSARNGKERWRISVKGIVRSAPVVAGSSVLFRDASGSLVAVNAETGALEWSFPALGPSATAPAVANDTAYAGDEAGNLFAVDVRTGAEKWRSKLGGGIFSTPLIAGRSLYVASRDRQLSIVDTENGEVLWKYETEGTVDAAFGAGDDLVVAADSSGTYYGLSEAR